MRGSRGGSGPPPPRNLQSLISPILLEMKNIVIFHICALPQLYVKVGPPPLEKFSGSAPEIYNILDGFSQRKLFLCSSFPLFHISQSFRVQSISALNTDR